MEPVACHIDGHAHKVCARVHGHADREHIVKMGNGPVDHVGNGGFDRAHFALGLAFQVAVVHQVAHFALAGQALASSGVKSSFALVESFF